MSLTGLRPIGHPLERASACRRKTLADMVDWYRLSTVYWIV